MSTRLHAAQRGSWPYLDLLGEPTQLRIIVARRFELGEGELAIVQDRGSDIVVCPAYLIAWG
jgi:hypothetical protein